MIGASGFVGTRLLDLLREEPQKYERILIFSRAHLSLDEGLRLTLEFDFVHPRTDEIQFISE